MVEKTGDLLRLRQPRQSYPLQPLDISGIWPNLKALLRNDSVAIHAENQAREKAGPSLASAAEHIGRLVGEQSQEVLIQSRNSERRRGST
jgi:hypothetical protein